jgi:hypothetical protein
MVVIDRRSLPYFQRLRHTIQGFLSKVILVECPASIASVLEPLIFLPSTIVHTAPTRATSSIGFAFRLIWREDVTYKSRMCRS